jgi:catechol 2,3-dioxygenase-like lactoylglutathione lyase family enzyme
MLFGKLFHAAIKAADLDATVRFYTEVLGMVVAPRPPLGFPGAWLKPAQVDAEAAIHVYGGDAAKEPDGTVLSGTAAIDHVSVVCQGYSAFKAQFERFGLPYRENIVPRMPMWQLFVYDPNGVQLELSFHAAAEREADPVIPPQRLYAARERWFQPELYRQFAAH